ncbi:MAG: glycosyltransferase family 2 protein [Ignavibacteriales bacterium]|nr:glycosyltransferase family 2 protein [Ignavibacteriales bacterium]
MNEKPTVSVIIPTYNRARLIGRSIQSVLNQTYQDFEIIVVDDGSIDNTREVIKEFQRKDKRINYIKHDENKGGSAARNTGIKASRGEYIAFQDSDDEWLPEKLEKQMKMFEKVSLEIGVIYTGFWRMEEDKREYIPSDKIIKKEGDIHTELLKENFVTTQSIVVRKECFGKAGMFEEDLPRLQDWELVLRLSKYYHFKYVDEPLLVSHHSPDSISSNNEALIRAYELIINKHHLDFAKHKLILSKHMYFLGGFLCLNYNFPEGKKYLIEAVKKHPVNIKYLLKVFISFFGQDIYRMIFRLYNYIAINRKNSLN